eukprot:Rmarinus@m.23058
MMLHSPPAATPNNQSMVSMVGRLFLSKATGDRTYTESFSPEIRTPGEIDRSGYLSDSTINPLRWHQYLSPGKADDSGDEELNDDVKAFLSVIATKAQKKVLKERKARVLAEGEAAAARAELQRFKELYHISYESEGGEDGNSSCDDINHLRRRLAESNARAAQLDTELMESQRECEHLRKRVEEEAAATVKMWRDMAESERQTSHLVEETVKLRKELDEFKIADNNGETLSGQDFASRVLTAVSGPLPGLEMLLDSPISIPAVSVAESLPRGNRVDRHVAATLVKSIMDLRASHHSMCARMETMEQDLNAAAILEERLRSELLTCKTTISSVQKFSSKPDASDIPIRSHRDSSAHESAGTTSDVGASCDAASDRNLGSSPTKFDNIGENLSETVSKSDETTGNRTTQEDEVSVAGENCGNGKENENCETAEERTTVLEEILRAREGELERQWRELEAAEDALVEARAEIETLKKLLNPEDEDKPAEESMKSPRPSSPEPTDGPAALSSRRPVRMRSGLIIHNETSKSLSHKSESANGSSTLDDLAAGSFNLANEVPHRTTNDDTLDATSVEALRRAEEQAKQHWESLLRIEDEMVAVCAELETTKREKETLMETVATLRSNGTVSSALNGLQSDDVSVTDESCNIDDDVADVEGTSKSAELEARRSWSAVQKMEDELVAALAESTRWKNKAQELEEFVKQLSSSAKTSVAHVCSGSIVEENECSEKNTCSKSQSGIHGDSKCATSPGIEPVAGKTVDVASSPVTRTCSECVDRVEEIEKLTAEAKAMWDALQEAESQVVALHAKETSKINNLVEENDVLRKKCSALEEEVKQTKESESYSNALQSPDMRSQSLCSGISPKLVSLKSGGNFMWETERKSLEEEIENLRSVNETLRSRVETAELEAKRFWNDLQKAEESVTAVHVHSNRIQTALRDECDTLKNQLNVIKDADDADDVDDQSVLSNNSDDQSVSSKKPFCEDENSAISRQNNENADDSGVSLHGDLALSPIKPDLETLEEDGKSSDGSEICNEVSCSPGRRLDNSYNTQGDSIQDAHDELDRSLESMAQTLDVSISRPPVYGGTPLLLNESSLGLDDTLGSLRGELSGASADVAGLREELAHARKILERSRDEYRAMLVNAEKTQQESEKIRDEIERLQCLQTKSEHEKHVLQARVVELEGKLKSMASDHLEETTSLHNAVAAATKQLHDTESLLRSCEETAEQLKMEITQSREEAFRHKEHVEELIRENTRLDTENAKLREDHLQDRTHLDALRAECGFDEAAVAQLKERVQELQSSLTLQQVRFTTEMEALHADRASVEGALVEKEERLRTCEATVTELRADLGNARAKAEEVEANRLSMERTLLERDEGLRTCEATVTELRVALGIARAELKRMEERVATFETDQKKGVTDAAEKKLEEESMKLELDSLRSALQDVQQSLQRARDREEIMKRNMENIAAELEISKQQLEEKELENSSLSGFVKRREEEKAVLATELSLAQTELARLRDEDQIPGNLAEDHNALVTELRSEVEVWRQNVKMKETQLHETEAEFLTRISSLESKLVSQAESYERQVEALQKRVSSTSVSMENIMTDSSSQPLRGDIKCITNVLRAITAESRARRLRECDQKLEI